MVQVGQQRHPVGPRRAPGEEVPVTHQCTARRPLEDDVVRAEVVVDHRRPGQQRRRPVHQPLELEPVPPSQRGQEPWGPPAGRAAPEDPHDGLVIRESIGHGPGGQVGGDPPGLPVEVDEGGVHGLRLPLRPRASGQGARDVLDDQQDPRLAGSVGAEVLRRQEARDRQARGQRGEQRGLLHVGRVREGRRLGGRLDEERRAAPADRRRETGRETPAGEADLRGRTAEGLGDASSDVARQVPVGRPAGGGGVVESRHSRPAALSLM